MAVVTTDGSAIREAVRAALERCGARRSELIPILMDVNRTLGYVPPEAFEEISAQLRVPKSQLFSVATFYEMIATKKRGRHVVQFCESAPCHVAGGRQVWQALRDALEVQPGETTPDGKWTFITVSCLGVCGVGPVMIVDDDIYGNIQPAQVAEILGRYA